ncbi:hypothetical protein MIND_01398200 [Mycena indigotica]|uniref:S-adenosyl-L-methionine-dependent methyltransferase n=1 Tax=Mycena indigotica TaxID=2126181 RepID=A0A8H6VV34_9AGAR|nr:uncharacterized protein MIND_01398200 [Mycena indigotica]KAF7289359.1 hypothetical protein MIND_01398200 [Mycena indigotica]
MEISLVFDLFDDMRAALQLSVPTIARALLRSPSLLFHPAALSRIGMAAVWVAFGEGGDENSRKMKIELITPHAEGVVLDLGAGHGHVAQYLDREKVSKYIALEPNTLMHARLRDRARLAGFDEETGTLAILSCGAEDTKTILSSLEEPVTTIVSVLTLCSVPDPQETIRKLVANVLAPGGTLIMHEHVRSYRRDVAFWQGWLGVLWRMVFDGCNIDRLTDVWVRELVDENGESVWTEGSEVWNPAMEAGESMLPRRNGRFVKKG